MKSSHRAPRPDHQPSSPPKGGRTSSATARIHCSARLPPGSFEVCSRTGSQTAKHFVGNDSEFERNTIDSQMDERTCARSPSCRSRSR